MEIALLTGNAGCHPCPRVRVNLLLMRMRRKGSKKERNLIVFGYSPTHSAFGPLPRSSLLASGHSPKRSAYGLLPRSSLLASGYSPLRCACHPPAHIASGPPSRSSLLASGRSPERSAYGPLPRSSLLASGYSPMRGAFHPLTHIASGPPPCSSLLASGHSPARNACPRRIANSLSWMMIVQRLLRQLQWIASARLMNAGRDAISVRVGSCGQPANAFFGPARLSGTCGVVVTILHHGSYCFPPGVVYFARTGSRKI